MISALLSILVPKQIYILYWYLSDLKESKSVFEEAFFLLSFLLSALFFKWYFFLTDIIIQAMVDVANEVGADAVSHGCTGKGNDQACLAIEI